MSELDERVWAVLPGSSGARVWASTVTIRLSDVPGREVMESLLRLQAAGHVLARTRRGQTRYYRGVPLASAPSVESAEVTQNGLW